MAVNTNNWNRMRYTLWAPIYDAIASFPRHRRRAIALLRPLAGEKVLIVGAGTGADLPFLPASAHITAVDITPAMLERLRHRAAALGMTVEAQVMDGQALAFASEQFDAVILHLILAVIPDPVACLREVERVLKPGGRAVVFDKFVPDDQEPSLGRRAANLIADLLFSDITRKLGPLVAKTRLVIEHREETRIAGVAFQTAILRKPLLRCQVLGHGQTTDGTGKAGPNRCHT
jgi:phosphatidylethanolamine/phosphatidyl-N-methylethanolamine N-methyltransferase